MLAHDLAQCPRLHVLERTAAGELIGERHLTGAGLTEQSGKPRREKLTAEYLITGSCAAGSGKLVLGARLTKIGIEQPVGEWSLNGSIDDLFRLERELAARVTAALGVASQPRRAAPVQESGQSPTLAIIPFKNQSPAAKLDVMETGFAEILQANLGAIPGVRLVERTQLEKILTEQKLSLSGMVDQRTAIQVGKLLQADRLLLGSFLELGPNLCLQVRLVDTDSAALLASEKVVGPREKFSESLEDLALKLIADLALHAPENAVESLRAALPAHSMESAIHYARANRLFRQGKSREAADAFQQAILVEPGNLILAMERMRVLVFSGAYAELVLTGRQAMAQPAFATATGNVRMSLLTWVAHGLALQNQYDELLAVSNQLLSEFPDRRCDVYMRLGNTLIKMNRPADALQMVEKAVDGDASVAENWRSGDLHELYVFYRFMDQRPGRRDSKVSKQAAQLALKLFDLVVAAAEGSRDQAAKDWSGTLIPHGVEVTFVDENNQGHSMLTSAEQAEYLSRALKTFGWYPPAASRGAYALAGLLEDSEQWEPALVAFREFLQNTDGIEHSTIPSGFDNRHFQPNAWIDERAEVFFHVATILQERLSRNEDAKRAWQDLVRESGLANFCGPDALRAMQELDIVPEYPEKPILVWGGDTDLLLAWQKVLSPAGFKVHSLREARLCPAHLAPYPLVILARSGCAPYSPSEVLALRNYVGSGGSLLVLVSPGWEAAAPGIHNGLLSFFDMAAGEESTIRAVATRVVRHAITDGVAKVMAKNSVALTAPPESVLIEADGKAILTAAPYRLGRIAVASFGQWFLPDPSVISGNPSITAFAVQRHRYAGHRSANVPMAELPLESGAGLQTDLLNNLIGWLAAPHHRGADLDRWRNELGEAHLAAAKVQAKIVSWNTLSPILDRLIENAPDPVAREESLWMAAEAYQQSCYEPGQGHLLYPNYGNFDGRRPDGGSAYYAKLDSQFSDSPLRPFAQWRRAECLRRSLYDENSSRRATSGKRAPVDPIATFEKVSAPAGSFAMFWSQLCLGRLHLMREQYREAAEQFRSVAENAPSGPEKEIAVLDLAICNSNLQNVAEARRGLQAVNSMPAIEWRPLDDLDCNWGVFSRQGNCYGGNTTQIVAAILKQLGAK